MHKTTITLGQTLLITSYHVLISRNILGSPLMGFLRERGWNIVVVAPKHKREFLEQEYGGEGIEVVGADNKLNQLDDFFKDIALAALRTHSLAVMRRRNMGMERPFFQKLFFFAPLLRRVIPFLYSFVMPTDAFRAVFETYRPSLVFATDVMSAHDCRLMHEAKRRGVPVVGMVRSWDNLTTKGGFRVIPDILVVQNEMVRKEAMELHSIPPERIRVVGIPHYDNYIGGATTDRISFLRELGIPLENRFLVYAPLGDRIVKVGDRIIPHSFDRHIVAHIAALLPKKTTLLVRLPPTDTVTLGESEWLQNIVVDRPGVSFGAGVKGVRSTELSRRDDERLRNTLAHASGVLTVFSSICVDAAIFGTPVALIGFDPEPVPYWESVKRIHEFEHIAPVLKSGGVDVIRCIADLKRCIGQYLFGKEASVSSGRLRMITEQCYTVDGASSKRLFGVLEEVALSVINR